ncbi:AAA family ATPase [Arthrospira platensis SPKY1]|nr:AAA family ATPase [Arthrospira platensis SPKY1]
MIVFRKISYRNFLSTGNIPIEIILNAHTTTILTGNSGSGKSSFLDAIAFSLFGRPFRNINKNEMVNTVNGGKCLVEVEFSIGPDVYKVSRGIKPTIFEIYKNGSLINQESHNKDYQEYLEKSILKFNFKTFSQIVVLGASNFTPFMKLKPADRRIIIESLLDINVFSNMNILLKKKYSELKERINTNQFNISLIE